MADGRMLKKAISTSRRLGDLKTDSARMLYTWIIPHLDVEGRFYADPDMVKGSVVPRVKTFTITLIGECLQDMADVGLISLYDVDGDKYLQLRKFEEHQNIKKDREAPSKIPPPSKGKPASSRPTQENSGVNQENSRIREDKIREVKLSEDKRSEESVRETKPASLKESKNTHGERWSDKQGEDLDELLNEIKNRYGARYYQECYVFVQSNFNKKNPEAVLHSLKRLIQDRLSGKQINTPGRWLESILNGNGKHPGENGKFEAQESQREAAQRSRGIDPAVKGLVAAIGGLNG